MSRSAQPSHRTQLKRRLQRRQRDHARAWKQYMRAVSGRWAPEVVQRFKSTSDVSLGRYDECRLIMNALTRGGR